MSDIQLDKDKNYDREDGQSQNDLNHTTSATDGRQSVSPSPRLLLPTRFFASQCNRPAFGTGTSNPDPFAFIPKGASELSSTSIEQTNFTDIIRGRDKSSVPSPALHTATPLYTEGSSSTRQITTSTEKEEPVDKRIDRHRASFVSELKKYSKYAGSNLFPSDIRHYRFLDLSAAANDKLGPMTTKKLNRSAKAEGQAPATLGDAPTSAKPTGTRDRRTSDKTSSAFRPASSSTEVRSIHPRTQKYGPPEATQEVQQQTAPTKPGIDTSTEHTPHKLDAYKTKITSEMHDASSQLLKELDNATSLEQSQQAASIPFMNNVRENPGEAPTESRFNASATLPDNGPRHDAGSKEGATASNPVKPSTVGVVTPARVSRAKGKASMSEEPLSQLASTSRKRKATKHVRKASAQVPKINRASTSQKPQQSNTLQHREVALPPYLSPLDLIRPILKFAAVAIITVACYLLFAFLAPFRFIFKIMMSIIAQIIVFIVFIDILWYSLCHSNASVGLLCRHSTPWSLSIPCSLPIIKAFTLCPAGIRSAEPGLVGPPVAVHEPPQLDVLLTGDGKGYEKLGQMAQKLMGLGPELPYHDEYLFQLRLLIRRKGIKNWQEIDTQILEIMAKNYALRRTLSSLNAKLETQAEFAGIFNEGAIGRLEEALRKPVKAPSVFNRLHETVIRWLPASKLAHRDRTKPATNRLADPVQKILQRHLEWKFRGIPETEALAEQASEILNAQNDRLLQISTLAANEEQEVSANQKALIAGRDPLTNILVRCISFEARDTDEFKEQLAALEHVQASYSRARDFVSIAQTGITDILNRQCQIKDTLRGLRRTDEEALQGGSGTMLRQYDEDDVITALRVLKGHIWKQEQSRVRLIKGVGGA